MVIGLLGACAEAGHGAAAASQEPLRVTLTSAKPEYAFGEPVVLDLAVENLGQEPVPIGVSGRIRIYVGPGEYWVSSPDRGMEFVERSATGGHYAPFASGCPGGTKQATELLQPGWGKHHRFRVLIRDYFKVMLAGTGRKPGSSPESPIHFELVCGLPGEYVALAAYPLSLDLQRGRILYSNLERFRVRPAGEPKVAVWHRIYRWDFLGFLESPGPSFREYRVSGEVADLAVEILQKHPNSPYDSAIRIALQHYYAYGRPDTRYEKSEEEKRATYLEFERRRQLIREVLQMPQWAMYDRHSERFHNVDLDAGKKLYVDDPRLDRQITLAVRPFVPMEHVIGDVFKTGNLPVRPHFDMRGHAYPGFTEKPSPVAPSLRGKYEMVVPHGVTSITDSVRGWMQRATPPGTQWVKDADGYKLVSAPEEEGNKH
jgi:hypothetical protein